VAQVTILRRERVLRVPTGGEATEAVEIAYSTPTTLPRTVYLPLDLYRPATPEELAVNPRYQMLPVNDQAIEVERKLIQADLKGYASSVPETFELP